MFKICSTYHYIYFDIFISQTVKTVTQLQLERYDYLTVFLFQKVSGQMFVTKTF